MRKTFGVWLIAAMAAFPCASFALDTLDARSQLLAADRAFSALSQKEDAATAFAQFAAPQALEFAPNADPLRGADKISVAMRGLKGKLSWEPVDAEAGASADIGYTWGHFEYREPGAKEIGTGTYVTIWRRQADGAWKFIVDIGNDGKSRPID